MLIIRLLVDVETCRKFNLAPSDVEMYCLFVTQPIVSSRISHQYPYAKNMICLTNEYCFLSATS